MGKKRKNYLLNVASLKRRKMEEKVQDSLEEAIQDLQKAKESLFNLHGEETKTAEIEHIDSAIAKLRSLKESE